MICEQTISDNASLAGIKHLNRLEQISAHHEWNNRDLSEGLMLNTQRQLIEGTMSNIFIVIGNKLLTPELGLSGISGIMRQEVIDCAKQAGIEVMETMISEAVLSHAQEIFITNSVIDIWPILEISGISTYECGNMTMKLQALVNDLTR